MTKPIDDYKQPNILTTRCCKDCTEKHDPNTGRSCLHFRRHWHEGVKKFAQFRWVLGSGDYEWVRKELHGTGTFFRISRKAFRSELKP